MANILFLSHRIPYPPNKGDKIRSWNFLKRLAEEHTVHLGCFVDLKDDRQYEAFLKERMETTCFQHTAPFQQKLLSLRGLLKGQCLTENAYPHKRLRSYVKDLIEGGSVDLIFLFSAATASLLPSRLTIPVVCDFVDVDSEKWRAYAETASWPMSWVYRREAEKLNQFEKSVYGTSQRSVFVSEDEATLFSALHGGGLKEISGIPNGVDFKQFDASQHEGKAQPKNIVFTGAMDYLPNIEAVEWFCRDMWPLIRAEHPDAVFTIGGGPVPARVKRLSANPNVTVLGFVENMAEVLAAAAVCVAPMKTARGIQNKILEAMAMSKPVVTTVLGNEGINAEHGEHLYVAGSPKEFATGVSALLDGPEAAKKVGASGHGFVKANFSWSRSYQDLSSVINEALR
ncbi:MAG: sugar transferase [Kordiimonadales bacterium]|nr:MAG: sugar transferase [Kordiimonadales bacterium]